MVQETDDPDALNVLVIERFYRTKNMARHYALSVVPTLFAESALVRRWGRIGGAETDPDKPSSLQALRADRARQMPDGVDPFEDNVQRGGSRLRKHSPCQILGQGFLLRPWLSKDDPDG